MAQLKLSWTEASHFFGRTFGDTFEDVLTELRQDVNTWLADVGMALATVRKTGSAIAFAGPAGLLAEGIRSGLGREIDALYAARDRMNDEAEWDRIWGQVDREGERRAEVADARKRRLEAIAAAVAAENAGLWDRAFAEDAPAGRRDPFAGIGQQMAAARGTFGSFGLSRSLGGTEPVQKAMLKELQGMNSKLTKLIDKTEPPTFD